MSVVRIPCPGWPAGSCERSMLTEKVMCRVCRRAKAIPDRFWSKVDRSGGPDACWPWMAATTSDGYGKLKARGRTWTASRLAWTLTNGEITPGLDVLHHCDNRLCCNPGHLFLGTNADNQRDMWEKQRARDNRGRALKFPRLTDEQVVYIRSESRRGVSRATLARELGISYYRVRAADTGRNYRSVPPLRMDAERPTEQVFYTPESRVELRSDRLRREASPVLNPLVAPRSVPSRLRR